jgi:lysophospholipase L1-like esterase
MSILTRSFLSSRFCSIGIIAGLAACLGVLGYSYALNSVLFFYDGLVGAVAVLWLGKLRWRANVLVQMVANTGILFALLLPVADALLVFLQNRAKSRIRPALVSERVFSYEVARGNPAQFAVWWNRFLLEWDSLSHEIVEKSPDRRLPYRLKPGSTGHFFESEIKINSLGFRDQEFGPEKGDPFRIVALGESTTMGLTLLADDRPWPDLLEEWLNRDVGGKRRVQVINAGVAGYSLRDSLVQLRTQILPLKPDLIVSYHGYNGFHFLDDTLAPEERWDLNAEPPAVPRRPLALLAQAEYRMRLIAFRSRHSHRNLSVELFEHRKERLESSEYTRLFAELIDITRSEGIPLVVLGFNMAVNEESPSEVMDFYRGGFPDVKYRVQANRLQDVLLRRLSGRTSKVTYVDTSEGLDGHPENFYDLVHLTRIGKQRLAGKVLKVVSRMLREDGAFGAGGSSGL